MEYHTQEEIVTILENLPKGKVLFPIERKGESYVFPQYLIGLMATSGGLIKRNTDAKGSLYIGHDLYLDYNIPTDNTDAAKVISTGEAIHVVGVLAECKCSSDVATRTFRLQVDLATLILGTNTGAWHSGDVTLTASQEGMVILAGNVITILYDNGTVTFENTNPLPAPWAQGATLKASITANKQTSDRTALSILYEKRKFEATAI